MSQTVTMICSNTTIKVRSTTRDRLAKLGTKAHTYHMIIIEMLDQLEVERHQKCNDPYDFIVKFKKNGKVYTKYIEIKSGNATLSKREKEFQAAHPHSYKIVRCDADSDFYKFKEEFRSLFSLRDWKEFF
jgi:hypothetical protein